MEQSESGNQKAEYEETRMQCEAAPTPSFGVYRGCILHVLILVVLLMNK